MSDDRNDPRKELERVCALLEANLSSIDEYRGQVRLALSSAETGDLKRAQVNCHLADSKAEGLKRLLEATLEALENVQRGGRDG